MLRNVVAINKDEFSVDVLIVTFEVPNEEFNLEYWVRKAATDYVNTKEGREIYDYNCAYFNWVDFAIGVPNSFCEKYGFKRVYNKCSDITVDWSEMLVDNNAVITDI